MRPTGEEIAEADIEAAWEAAPMLATAAGPRRPASVDREGMTTVDWHKAPVETEQLDLFAAVG
ncbi:MAG: hypothetical protein JST59_30175 [Actinobacteria bacterium]|nr:hypothetical protein [Actinomycetota bacterium]